MEKINVIPTWQFKDTHCIWGKTIIPTLWPESTLNVGALNIIPIWQFKDAHCIWGQSVIPTLWP
jgi:hypothetical protein